MIYGFAMLECREQWQIPLRPEGLTVKTGHMCTCQKRLKQHLHRSVPLTFYLYTNLLAIYSSVLTNFRNGWYFHLE